MRLSSESPPSGEGRARKTDRFCRAITSENSSHAIAPQEQIPSRATLARRFPRLRLNRFNGKWADDATGAKGDDLKSLLAFLREGGR